MMAIGIVIGLLFGIPLGAIALTAVIAWLFIAGQLAVLQIAELANRLIEADSEPAPEPPSTKRRSL
jgi:hypothetical protein